MVPQPLKPFSHLSNNSCNLKKARAALIPTTGHQTDCKVTRRTVKLLPWGAVGPNDIQRGTRNAVDELGWLG